MKLFFIFYFAVTIAFPTLESRAQQEPRVRAFDYPMGTIFEYMEEDAQGSQSTFEYTLKSSDQEYYRLVDTATENTQDEITAKVKIREVRNRYELATFCTVENAKRVLPKATSIDSVTSKSGDDPSLGGSFNACEVVYSLPLGPSASNAGADANEEVETITLRAVYIDRGLGKIFSDNGLKQTLLFKITLSTQK